MMLHRATAQEGIYMSKELQAITKAKKRIEEIRTQRAAEIQERTEQLHAAEIEQAQAQSTAADAIRHGNSEEYEQAKAAEDEAAGRIAFCRTRLNHIETDGTAMISEEEYKELQAGILDGITALQAAEAERLSAIAQEFLVLRDNLVSAIENGNAVLNDLQIDVYKMQDMPNTLKYNANVNSTRTPYIFEGEQRIYKDWSFVDFLNTLIPYFETAGYIQ